MKKFFTALVMAGILAGTCVVTAGDTGFSYKQIERFVDRDGQYDELLQYMEAGMDENLSLEDYAYLYYGFSFTDAYVYDLAPVAEMSIYEMTEQEDYDGAWDACRRYLDEYPFSTFALNLGVFLADHANDLERADKYYRRSGRIVEVIEASGDGSEQRPYQVLHSGDMLYYLKYQMAVEVVVGFEETGDGRFGFGVEREDETFMVWFAYDLCRKKEGTSIIEIKR